MNSEPRAPLWYKDAIIYELYVRSFQDGNGDGVGDFAGAIQRLDYLAKLGINCVWLLPFYPSPMRDGGYDISDYTSVHPDYGSMADFRRFVREAHRRGIRILIELVINHTSDQHAWFQRARRAPKDSAARGMYVWSDSPDRYDGTRIIFTDTETSNWAWDPVAGQYYWHRFFSHQPDLNFESGRVLASVKRFIKFWFDAGVDGLRLDAIPYLREREGTNNENLPETHEVLKDIRSFVDTHYADRLLLAEANQWPADVRAYFGDGDECHMAFHFPVMPRLFMALRQEDRHPIVDILAQTPEIPESCQWALFLRNHDELTLEMVTDEERDYMYSVYATNPRMKVNVGIRRRLAPLLDNNRRAIELLNSLLFSLPGTPILYYGDELAMGDNIFLGDRDGVRTPMQWTGDRNSGFSSADPARLFLPVIMDPLYGYQSVNVEAHERTPSSLLNWMRRMIALRRERRVFGRGSMEMLHPSNRKVLAFVRRFEDEAVLVVANLSRFVQPVELDLSEFAGSVPVEMLGKTPFPPITDSGYPLSLGPHTFYWFDLQPAAQPAALEVGGTPAEPMLETIRVELDWDALLARPLLERIEQEVLPAFIGRQRWFGGKSETIDSMRVLEVMPIAADRSPMWWTFVEVAYASRAPEVYCVPLAVATGRAMRRLIETTPGAVLAPVVGPRGRGVLCDATALDAACLAILEGVRAGQQMRGAAGSVRSNRTRAFASLYEALEDAPAVERVGGEQSNTSVRLGEQLVLKVLRRVEPGIHPDVEVSAHLTLAEFARSPKLAGSVAYSSERGAATIATLQEYVWSQGDGWRFTLEEVRRFLEDAAVDVAIGGEQATRDLEAFSDDVDPLYSEAARVLGMRTAEMHRALATPLDDPAFVPEPITPEDFETIVARINERLARAAARIEPLLDGLSPEAAADAEVLLAYPPELATVVRHALGSPEGVSRIRVHGDYHLGQVLWVRNDFAIIDFEGEVGLPLDQRRGKTSALVDVAGMVRSFSYAAAVGQRMYSETLPDVGGAGERLRRAADLWQQSATASFLRGYLEAAADAEFVPHEADRFARWLDVMMLDKALHELEYELAHRPDWVPVPLRGIAQLLRGLE